MYLTRRPRPSLLDSASASCAMIRKSTPLMARTRAERAYGLKQMFFRGRRRDQGKGLVLAFLSYLAAISGT